MGSEMGRRTDIEFTTTTMDDVINRDKKERAIKNEALINKKLKEFKSRGYAYSWKEKIQVHKSGEKSRKKICQKNWQEGKIR